MENPSDRKYTKEHEWAKVEGETATVGITYFAQEQLTDVVFVELPEIGKKVIQFKPAAIVESVKSVSDIFAPMSGEIIEVNEELKGKPELVNQDPFGKAWIFKMKIDSADEQTNLMSSKDYDHFLKEKVH